MILRMDKILVSACLLGEKTTYLGGDNRQDYLTELNRYYDLVPFCPEVEGGLPTPRKPSEQKSASVYMDDGTDVTSAFNEGAYKATAICSFLGIRLAILKERSPSCGVHQIHDGRFKGNLIPGEGVTTAALRRMGVRVYNEEEGIQLLEEAKRRREIIDERTKAIREKGSEEPKEEKPRRDVHRDYPKGRPAGRSYQGKTRPFTKGGKKPFRKKER